jgi:hypothetical protein
MAKHPFIKAIFKPTTRPTGAVVLAPKTKLNLSLVQVNTGFKLPWKAVLSGFGLGLLAFKLLKEIFKQK